MSLSLFSLPNLSHKIFQDIEKIVLEPLTCFSLAGNIFTFSGAIDCSHSYGIRGVRGQLLKNDAVLLSTNLNLIGKDVNSLDLFWCSLVSIK